MQYLVFDIECAQCQRRDFTPICSFGYALFDDGFELISSEDIVIDPGAKFDLEFIEPAYPKSVYNSASKFYVHYKKISELLTAPDTEVVAFNTGSDMKYLRNDCKRYNLPEIDVFVHDAVDFIKLLEEQAPPVSYSLTSVCERLGITVTNEHNSEYDALRTGLCMGVIVRRITEQSGLKFPEIVDIIAAKHDRAGLVKPSRVNRRHVEGKEELRRRKNIYSGRAVCATHTIEDSHLFSRLAKRLVDVGAWYTTAISEADVFLTVKGDADAWRISEVKRKIAAGGKIDMVNFDEFMKE